MGNLICPLKFSAELELVFTKKDTDPRCFECEPSCAWWDGETDSCAIMLIAKQKHGLKKLFNK